MVVNARTLGARLTGVQRYAAEILERLGARVEQIAPPVPLQGPLGHAWEQLALPARLRGRLLWSPGNTGPLAVERQVLSVHDLSAFDCPAHLKPAFVRWYRWLLPRLARVVRQVIVPSRFTRERLAAVTGVAAERVSVVPLGADPRFGPRGPGEVERARARLALPSPHYLLSLGSLEPRKNLPRLLRAWECVQARLPEEIWLVVAGGPGSRRIFSRARLSPSPRRVLLTGYVGDQHLPALYSGALAFLFLSEYEGFGLPPLEAMACGTPVISSDRASLPEVVGDAALLVDPLDLEAIQAAIQATVERSDLREGLRARGLQRARGFSWDRAADQVWRLLRDSAG